MAAKSALFVSVFLVLSASAAWCETVAVKTAEAVEVEAEKLNANAEANKPDPYANVTWDSVTNNNAGQTQSVTVYSQTTSDADFISVSSTANNAGASDVAVVVPAERKSKKWFFW
jgi:hypothetical protein